MIFFSLIWQTEIKFWRAKEEETGFARRVQTKRPVMELFPNWLEALEEVA